MRNILYGQVRPQFFFDIPDDDGGGDGDGEEGKSRVGGKEQIHISKDARKFAERFRPPAGTPGIPVAKEPLVNENEPPAGETAEQKAAREKEQEERRAANPTLEKRETKKPGANVPQILADKRKAEQALAEKEKAVEKYEKEEIPKLTNQIADLQKKIDSGQLSSSKEAEFETKIAALEKARADKEAELSGELETTRKRLAQLSLPDDPIYKEKYLKPLGESIESLQNIIGANVVLRGALNRAMIAQRSALEATSEEQLRDSEKERDDILDSMLEGMTGETQRRRMTAAFDKFVEASTAQAMAAADHERTSLEIRKESERRYAEGVKGLMMEWEGEYRTQAEEYNPDASLSAEEQKAAKDLGVEYDADANEKLAIGAIRGDLKRPDVVKLIHRGRAYHGLKAKLAIAKSQLKEAQETVTKLRGASPSGAGRGTTGGDRQPAPVLPSRNEEKEAINSEGKTRKQWQDRFRPPVG